MTDLPRALMPWAEHLDLLPRELALAFGPLVARVDSLIGTLHRAPRFGTTEPDGFDGLARRGSYERLLLSEWLLAEEAPDEFLRRAANGEHAFHRLAHRDPAASRVCVALFDAGPNQLGSPRLVHLAALIVLARRAEASGARFVWGVLQKPPHLHETVNSGTIRSWLRERGVTEADESHVQQWRAALAELGCPSAQAAVPRTEIELWTIGSRRLLRLEDPSTARLFVRDVLEPGVRQVGIEVQEMGRPAREVILDLPEEDACARLLRDPFASMVAEMNRAPEGLSVQSNLVWSASGNRLFARTADGTLTAFTIPDSPSDNVGRPKVYRPQVAGQILGAGRVGKATILAILRDENTIVLEKHGKKSSRVQPGEFNLETPLPTGMDYPLQPCLLWAGGTPPGSTGADEIWLPLDGERLVRLHHDTTDHSVPAVVLDERVFIAAEQERRLVYISTEGRKASMRVLVKPGEAGENRALGRPRAAFKGYASDLGHPIFGLWAIQHETGRWHILANSSVAPLEAPAAARVIGVMHLPGRWPTPGLVVIDEDGRTISLLGLTWSHSLPRASSPIVHAAVNSAMPCIAYSTESGGVEVFAVLRDTHVLRYESAQTGAAVRKKHAKTDG